MMIKPYEFAIDDYTLVVKEGTTAAVTLKSLFEQTVEVFPLINLPYDLAKGFLLLIYKQTFTHFLGKDLS